MATEGQQRILPSLTLVAFLVSASAVHAADPFLDARRAMIREDIAGRGVSSPAVLRAMGAVPRHLFVPRLLRSRAYRDFPLPIGEGQTISQPYVVALMTEALGLKGEERVLEIGTGSGYQAAVLAEIVAEVYSIEIIPSLAERSRRTLKENGYGKVQVRNGDGYFGWPGKAPFDVIIITAAANHIPPPLLDQLKVGGRLILPLGRTTHTQTLTLVTKEKEKFVVDQLGGVRFVPMVGDAQKARPDQAAPR
jgi:protein-L-isoaspartate(D-aspartate) O-methyltransferase